MNRTSHGWRGLALLIGALAIVALYYWTHKPIDPFTIAQFGGIALDLITAGALALLSGGIGRAALNAIDTRARLGLDALTCGERVGLAGVVGFASVAIGALVIGMVGGFRFPLLWGGLIVAAIAARRGLFAHLGDLRAGWDRWVRSTGASDRDTTAWTRLCARLVLILLAGALLLALAPPQTWDALAYQLVAPARYLETGRIEGYVDNFYLGFPQQVNMLFGMAIAPFGRDTAAAPVHFVFGLYGLLAVMGVVRRLAGRAAGWTAGVLLMSSYNVWALFGWPYTDLAVMSYGALAIVAVERWWASLTPRPALPLSKATAGRAGESRLAVGWLIVLGVIAGSAIGVKYTAGALLIAVAFAVGVLSLVRGGIPRPSLRSPLPEEGNSEGETSATPHRPSTTSLLSPPLPAVAFDKGRGGRGVRDGGEGSLRASIVSLLIIGVTAAIAFAPWAIRAWIQYGNPIYPFAFGGLNWNPLRAEFFSFSERGLAAIGQAWQAALLPISATVFGLDRTDGFGFTLGPWLLTLPLALPIVWRWLDTSSFHPHPPPPSSWHGEGEKSARRLAIVGLVLAAPLLAIWTVTALGSSVGMQTRLMILILPIGAVLGGAAFAGIAAMPRKPFDTAFVLRALIVVTLAFHLVEIGRMLIRDRVVQTVIGVEPIDSYLYQNTGAHIGAMRTLNDLPAQARVRFLWEPRAYYCPPAIECLADVLFDHWLLPAVEGVEPDAIFEAWRAAGDDYLLVWRAGYDEYRVVFDRYGAAIDPFFPALERAMTPVWTDNVRYTLYAWR